MFYLYYSLIYQYLYWITLVILPVMLSAINLKQVEVEFNSAKLLDKDVAAKVDNTLKDADGDEIELVSADVDSNKVVLTIKDGDEVDNKPCCFNY